MHIIEVPVSINREGEVFIPKKFIKILPKEKKLKAIFQIPDTNSQEIENWKKTTTIEFFKGYDEKDSIYDTL